MRSATACACCWPFSARCSPLARPGDFLFASLHRTGYANQPTSTHRDDGLELTDCFITAAVKCAPPQNKPTPSERDACRPFLERELEALARVQVIVTLGQFGWDA